MDAWPSLLFAERIAGSDVLKGKDAMLDAFIIEELKRRERERQQHERSRPALEIPLPDLDREQEEEDRRSEEKQERPQRGVIVIDLKT